MHIQYYLSDGQEINYMCQNPCPTMEDVDNLAMLYAQMRPNDLPDTVFCSVRMYKQFMSSFYSSNVFVPDKETGLTLMNIHTAVGVVRVIPMPMASDAKLFLVGKREDFDRYDIDKIFEETVMKDFDREESTVHRRPALKDQ